MAIMQVTSVILVFFLKSREPVSRLALKAPGTVRVKQVPHHPGLPSNTRLHSQSSDGLEGT